MNKNIENDSFVFDEDRALASYLSEEPGDYKRVISNITNRQWRSGPHDYFYRPKEFNSEQAALLLVKAKEVFDRIGLKFFLTCGTALGFYRDGGFIPWDDEIDIDVFSEEFVPVFDDLAEAFIQKGFIVRATPRHGPHSRDGASGIASKMGLYCRGIKISIGGVYLDDADSKYRQGLHYQWLNKFYLEGNYTIYNYKGHEYKLPGPMDEYLTFCYGDWRTPLKTNNHYIYMNMESGQFKYPGTLG